MNRSPPAPGGDVDTHARDAHISAVAGKKENGARIGGSRPLGIHSALAAVENDPPIGREPRRESQIVKCIGGLRSLGELSVPLVTADFLHDGQRRVVLHIPTGQGDVAGVDDDEGRDEDIVDREFTCPGEYHRGALIDEDGACDIHSDVDAYRTIHDKRKGGVLGRRKGSRNTGTVIRFAIATDPAPDRLFVVRSGMHLHREQTQCRRDEKKS